MNRSAKGGARSSLRFEDEGVLIHPPHQGVCGRHGTEEQRVTSGELTESPVGIGVSGPISASEIDRKSTRLNSSHGYISYAVFCLKKKNNKHLPSKPIYSASIDI